MNNRIKGAYTAMIITGILFWGFVFGNWSVFPSEWGEGNRWAFVVLALFCSLFGYAAYIPEDQNKNE